MISQIQIETSSLCPAKCVFCPHKTLKREVGLMDDKVFDKIIADCKDVGVHSICPFLNGEMFTDIKIFKRLKKINKELPNTNIIIFSNMYLLDKVKIEQLSQIKNIGFFCMSLTGYDKESYTNNMGLDFDIVYRNVMELIETNNRKKFIKNLQISSIDCGTKQNEKFVKLWGNIKGVDKMFVSSRQNWLGDIESCMPRNLNKRCPRTSHICILHDGRVALCCFDSEGKYQIGDVKTQSIKEIYKSERYKKYRTTLKKHLEPCKRCTV